MYSAPPLRKTAAKKFLQSTALNTMPNSQLKNSLLIEQKEINNLKKQNENIKIKNMLDEIKRLKNFADTLINNENFDAENSAEDIIANPYDHYFVYYYAQKKQEISHQNMSEELNDSLRRTGNTFFDFMYEEVHNRDLTFVGVVLNNVEEFAQYDANWGPLNILMADFIFRRDDHLLDYFIESYNNNYKQILSSLKDFAEYLGYVAVLKNDLDSLDKIKELYVEENNHNISLHSTNFELFTKYDRTLKKIRPNIKNEILTSVPRIEGGGLDKNNYAVILMSAIVMGIASLM